MKKALSILLSLVIAVTALPLMGIASFAASSTKWPNPPKLVSVANAAKGITVKWNAVSTAKGYFVYRKTGSSSWTRLKTVTGTSYTDTSSKAGTTYTYTVKAYKGKSYTKYDTKGLSIIRLTNPAVTLGNAKDGIKASWAKVTGAKGYYVYRKTGSDAYTKIATVSSLSYMDMTAKAGTNYRYAVYAYNGKTKSACTPVTIIRLTTPVVTLTETASGIKAAWKKVAGAKGYIIYRKTGSESYSKIATTTALSYLDMTAKKGKTYYYAVRAYNGSYKSGYTNNRTPNTITDAASLAKLINQVTGEAVAAKAGYNWKRVCQVNNVSVGSSGTTSMVNSFINGISEGDDLNSVVGGYLGAGTKSATVKKGQTLETTKVKNDQGNMENIYHASDYKLIATKLSASDISQFQVRGNTYKVSIPVSSYEGDNANTTSLWKATHDMLSMSAIDREIKGFTSSAGVNSLKANYGEIILTAVISDGKLTSLSYQFVGDATLGVKLGISLTCTADFKVNAQFTNISY